MSEDKEPVSAPLRRLGASLLTLGRIRLELFAIEAQEEKERVAGLLLWAVLAALLAGFGLLRCGIATACWPGAAARWCWWRPRRSRWPRSRR